MIARQPAVVLVDEIAHTNAPGSRHARRWQDAEELLEHGITVVSTLNIQHLESLADIVERITGVAVRERVPDAVLDGADEVQLVDMTPHALRQRIHHGNVYPPERAAQALSSFFREGNLTALRELVLRRCRRRSRRTSSRTCASHDLEASWPAGQAVAVVLDATPATSGPGPPRLAQRPGTARSAGCHLGQSHQPGGGHDQRIGPLSKSMFDWLRTSAPRSYVPERRVQLGRPAEGRPRKEHRDDLRQRRASLLARPAAGSLNPG